MSRTAFQSTKLSLYWWNVLLSFKCSVIPTGGEKYVEINRLWYYWEGYSVMQYVGYKQPPTIWSYDLQWEHVGGGRSEISWGNGGILATQMFNALMSMWNADNLSYYEGQWAIDAANNATVVGYDCWNGIIRIVRLLDGREGAVAKTLDLRGDGTGIGLNEDGDCVEDCDGSGMKRGEKTRRMMKNAGKWRPRIPQKIVYHNGIGYVSYDLDSVIRMQRAAQLSS